MNYLLTMVASALHWLISKVISTQGCKKMEEVFKGSGRGEVGVGSTSLRIWNLASTHGQCKKWEDLLLSTRRQEEGKRNYHLWSSFHVPRCTELGTITMSFLTLTEVTGSIFLKEENLWGSVFIFSSLTLLENSKAKKEDWEWKDTLMARWISILQEKCSQCK